MRPTRGNRSAARATALARIDGAGRRRLALRSCLRGGDRLAERSRWTEAQIASYQDSAEHPALQAGIELVRAAFTRDNPGFDLRVNPQVRSLDRQPESRNTSDSVTEAAANLAAAAGELVGSATFPAADPARARAVDFQLHPGDRIIRGPRISTVATEWDQAGWSVRFEDAVRAASRRFIGPLASPRAPWHCTYAPEAVAAQ